MNTETQSTSMDSHVNGNVREIDFFIDGEPEQTTAFELTPNEILKDYAKVDPATHYLVQIEGNHRESYDGRGDVPIKMHNNLKFQVVSREPTTVSDPVARTGVDFFLRGLKALGYDAAVLPGTTNRITFDYEVPAGKHAGKKLKKGLEVPQDFPATSPSGPHVSEVFHPNKQGGNHPTGGIHSSPFGPGWQYWSRPVPGWAHGKKTVGAYMSHLDRLWASQ